MIRMRSALPFVVLPTLLATALAGTCDGGTFIFANESNGIDTITHPKGYYGWRSTLRVSVCIDPRSPHALEMIDPVRNAVSTYNALVPTTGNLRVGAANDVPPAHVDFQSMVMHELGHCVGLGHPNAASESGLPGSARNYTRATPGPNGVWDVALGPDGIPGSDDDLRGDDLNLHWFRIATNDPFDIAPVVDKTTYSRNLADLPASHLFAANADRTVGIALGVPNTEAVMQQETFSDEAQRELAHDDVATLRLGFSGLDMVEGTFDDYDLALEYVGLTAECDVPLAFDDARTGFAECVVGGYFINSKHIRIGAASIAFNGGFNWFFTGAVEQPSPACPPAPDVSCVTGFDRAVLRVNEVVAGKERISSRWIRGPSLSSSDFGDPTVFPGTDYAACLYDDAGRLVAQYGVPRAAARCGARECWRKRDSRGWLYFDPTSSAAGVHRLRMRESSTGESIVLFAGANDAPRGRTSLPVGVAAALAGSTSATMQLFASDAPTCTSVTLTNVVRNDSVRFYARRSIGKESAESLGGVPD